MTQSIPFVIAFVADPLAPAAIKQFTTYLELLSQQAPHTPLVILSRLATAGEVALAQAAKDAKLRSGIQIWQLGRDQKPGSDGSMLVDKLCVVPPIAESLAATTSEARWELAWLCRHCNVLVAQVDKAAPGLAQEAIDFRLHSLPPELGGRRGVLFAPETGPVVELGAEAPEKRHFPPGEAEENLRQQLAELDTFNRLAQCERNRSAPFRHSLGKDAFAASEEPLVSAHCLADRLSRIHQISIKRRYKGILFGSFLAAIGLQVLGMMAHNLPMAVFYALFFFVLGLLFIQQRQHDHSDRHADYRVLAEALRVQLFWRQAGLPDAVAEHLLHKHRTRLAWVREALKGFHLEKACIDKPHPDKCLQPWIKQQADYHKGSQKRHAKWDALLDRSTVACYGISLALTLIVILAPKTWPSAVLHEWFGILLGIIASCGTLLLIYRASIGFGQRAAMGGRMTRLFEYSQSLFEADLITTAEKSELIRDLGCEVLFETGEWIFIEGPG